MPKPARATKDRVLFVRAPKTLIDRIDAYGARLRARAPGEKYHRSDVVRLLVERAMESDDRTWVTEHDVELLVRTAVERTAAALTLDAPDWKSSLELLDEIERTDGDTHGLLTAFLGAYDDWYALHKRIAKAGKSGKLNAGERAVLVEKIQRKDEAREALIAKLAKREIKRARAARRARRR